MFIVSYPANQLGNCLRSLLSTKILADSIGATFAIDFRHNRCSAEAATVIRKLLPDHILPQQALPDVRIIDERNCMRFIRLYGTNSDPTIEAIFDPEETFPKEGFGLLHIYSVRPDRMSVEDYIRTKHENYAKMRFPELLQERVEQFRRLHDMTNVTGMHNRYTDNLSDPLKKNLNTPFPVLEQKLQSLIAAGYAILLCTDNPQVRDHLRATYAKSMIFPDTVEPVLQPLYEMMLLAQTARVVGTYSSTFSYEACLFRGTDLELFEDGHWKNYRFSAVKSEKLPRAIFAGTISGAEETSQSYDPKSPARRGKIGRNEAVLAVPAGNINIATAFWRNRRSHLREACRLDTYQLEAWRQTLY